MEEKVMLVLILNKTELLDELLIAFSDAGINAATVLNSVGMAQQLSKLEEDRIVATLRPFLASDHTENKLVFTIIKKEDIPIARQTVREVIGDLSEPDTGILFAIPTIFTEGIQF